MDVRRVVSGVALGALGFAFIQLDTVWVSAVSAAVSSWLAYEWVRLVEKDGDKGGLGCRLPQIVLPPAVILALYVRPDYVPWLFAAAGVWWLVAFVCTVSFDPDRPCSQWRRLLFRIGPPLCLPALWASFVYLHMSNKWWLLYAVALVSVSDIGAYYAGRRFGGQRLCPDLSPGKTRSGLWGGLAASLVFCVATAYFAAPVWLDGVHLVLVSLCVVQAGVVGDLFVSMLKRYAGVKDSGAVLPGHGGVLDRLDSLLPALPLFFVATTGIRFF